MSGKGCNHSTVGAFCVAFKVSGLLFFSLTGKLNQNQDTYSYESPVEPHNLTFTIKKKKKKSSAVPTCEQQPAMEYTSVAPVSTEVPPQLSAGQTHSPTTGGRRMRLSWHPSSAPAISHAWPPRRFHPLSAPGRLRKTCSRLAGERVVKANICEKNNSKKTQI